MTPRAAYSEEGEQDPFAAVFMSFDPHRGEGPLVELIFDTHPSQLATISTVAGGEKFDFGDTVEERWSSYVHLAEHCLSERSTRLVLVLARAPAGASGAEMRKIKEGVMTDMLTLLKTSRLIKAGVAVGE